MYTSPAELPASQQWLLIADWLLLGSTVLLASVAVFTKWDRWLVSRRGIPGDALVERTELVQTLPRKVWEVRIQVIPEDISCLSFKRTVLWAEREFRNQIEDLEPGATLRVRFRRAPRPLVMPINGATWITSRKK